MEEVDKYILPNGMVILGEQMEQVESVAFNFMLPAGASMLPDGFCGAANVISDWIFRGAGHMNNRQLNDALDGLGLHRACSVSSSHLTVKSTLESSNLYKALILYTDILLRSRLTDEQFEFSRQLALDSVHSLDDDPRRKVMLQLRRQFYSEPFGRSTLGEIDELSSLTAEKIRDIVKEYFNIPQTIFSVAGKYDFKSVCQQLETQFKNEEDKPNNKIESGHKGGKYKHLPNDGAQVHIGLMTPTVIPTDKDYYNARVAVSVLSGGMSARLFTEVREKRGLCYAIGASYHSLKQAAGVMCYAGTTPQKAQETLDVIIGEFNLLSEQISQEEIDRAKIGLKAALILQNESSTSRAEGIATDYYLFGRVRSLDEIRDRIEETSVDSVLNFLWNNKFGDFTVVTIGPKEVDLK